MQLLLSGGTLQDAQDTETDWLFLFITLSLLYKFDFAHGA
jgi:hypothetical protein